MSLQSASRRLRQELHCHDDERMQNLLNKKTSTFRFEVWNYFVPLHPFFNRTH
jgi:hypothetical protein